MFTTTSHGGTLYLHENEHKFNKKKNNFFVCVEYMKLKCPAVTRMENDEFIVKNIQNVDIKWRDKGLLSIVEKKLLLCFAFPI